MDNSTTLIVLTRKKNSCEGLKLSCLNEYCRRYRNVSYWKFCREDDKEEIINIMEFSKSDNIIFIEEELSTRFHQIQKQIKKLKKCHLLLPNRFLKESKTKFKSKKEELRVKSNNLMINAFTINDYGDITNLNRGVKRKKMLPIIKSCETKDFWIEMVVKAKNQGIKISETKTHYVEEPVEEKDFVDKFFRRVKELSNLR